MSSSQFKQASKFAPIKDVLKTTKYGWIILGVGLAYAIVYMLVVGILSYVPGLTSATGNYPMIRPSSIGISIIPAEDIFFLIFYSALAFLIASSFLVGLNVALMFYSRSASTICGMKNNNKHVGSKGFLGLLPAFFTSFACCGGGLLALVTGPTAFSSLSLYSQYMAPITVVVLAAGTYFMSSKISKMERRC